MKLPLLLLLTASLCLSACAQKTYGDKLIDQADTTKSLGQRWNEGYAMQLKGKEMYDAGIKAMEAGRQQADDGNQMIAKGREMTQQAEGGHPPPQTSF